MKHVDEYRDAGLVRALADAIRRCVTRSWVVMEICGGHTHAILRYGIDELLPRNVHLVHGPGCPVCVTPAATVDRAIALALRPDTILVSYGDMLRVPGSGSDLARAKSAGADVRLAYSPMHALQIARENPERSVVLFAIGFETTAPATAIVVREATRLGVTNLSVLVSHFRVPAAIRLLLADADNRVQGFIAPGHVCAISGCAEYEELAREFATPMVVAGFEPVDLLQALLMLLRQLEAGRCEVENQYSRSVGRCGNPVAQQVMQEVFEPCDAVWRGIGPIAGSGYRLRGRYAAFDAEQVFRLAVASEEEPAGCISSLVLQGRKKPGDCPAFAVRCTPEKPMGASMVSAEGACAAYYRYRRKTPARPNIGERVRPK